MSSKENNKNDFLPDRREKRILRASDIMPPYNNPQQQQTQGFQPTGSPKEPFSLPQFDLAEEIMAEQRKATASKRKSPDQKIIPLINPVLNKNQIDLSGNSCSLASRNKIIVEIVARDIKKMCRLKTA